MTIRTVFGLMIYIPCCAIAAWAILWGCAKILGRFKMKKQHELTIKSIASGAGVGVCTCGWRSRVSDDGDLFLASYFSVCDIEDDFSAHKREEEEKMSK